MDSRLKQLQAGVLAGIRTGDYTLLDSSLAGSEENDDDGNLFTRFYLAGNTADCRQGGDEDLGIKESAAVLEPIQRSESGSELPTSTRSAYAERQQVQGWFTNGAGI